MRRVQIDIKFFYLDEIDRPTDLNVYADSNDIWETICSGFYELIDTLSREGLIRFPRFGRMEHKWKAF